TTRGKKSGTATGRAPKPSGRQRHDEKITVYISSPELLALEQARLALRAEHGVSTDRGRIVREAVAVLLADFEENGRSSTLVRRLTEERARLRPGQKSSWAWTQRCHRWGRTGDTLDP